MKKEIVSVMMAACLFASLATGCGAANERVKHLPNQVRKQQV